MAASPDYSDVLIKANGKKNSRTDSYKPDFTKIQKGTFLKISKKRLENRETERERDRRNG